MDNAENNNVAVADLAGLVDLLAGEAEVGGARRGINQTFRLGTFAYRRDLTSALRGIVFVGQA